MFGSVAYLNAFVINAGTMLYVSHFCILLTIFYNLPSSIQKFSSKKRTMVLKRYMVRLFYGHLWPIGCAHHPGPGHWIIIGNSPVENVLSNIANTGSLPVSTLPSMN